MNCIYSLPYFCSDFNILNRFSCLVCTWFQYLYTNSKDTINYIQTPIKNLWTFASEYLVKFCSFYHHLSLKTVLLAFKLTQICCINIYKNFFSWKLAIQSQIGSPSPIHIPSLKDCPYNPTKYESKWTQKY